MGKRKAPDIDPELLKQRQEAEQKAADEAKRIQDELDREERLRKTRQRGRLSLFATAGGEKGVKLSAREKVGG